MKCPTKYLGWHPGHIYEKSDDKKLIKSTKTYEISRDFFVQEPSQTPNYKFMAMPLPVI